MTEEYGFPLLGEPLPVEFANTRYGPAETDLIADGAALHAWLAAVGAVPRPDPPADPRLVRTVGELRDAVRELLAALAGGAPAPEPALATLNRHTEAATYRVRAERAPDGGVRLVTRHTGADPRTELLARLATETVALAAGAQARLLRRCTGPGCTMLFLRSHPRRRWCHPSCGHRARQADYYRRTRAAAAAGRRANERRRP